MIHKATIGVVFQLRSISCKSIPEQYIGVRSQNVAELMIGMRFRQESRNITSKVTGLGRTKENMFDREEGRRISNHRTIPHELHTKSSFTKFESPEPFNALQYVLPFPDRLEGIASDSVSKVSQINSAQDLSRTTARPHISSSSKSNEFMSKSHGSSSLIEFEGFKFKKRSAPEPDSLLQVIHGSGEVKPEIYEDVNSIRGYRREVARKGYSIGFVPTMGALHEGHLDLMRAAAMKNHEVWISIYVNPTQFGPSEDLSTYPSTWESDLAKVEKLNDELLSKGHARISTIFKPQTPEILYPYGVEGTSYVMINPEITQILEGSSRPLFFRGVTTVVMKLLNIIQPERVYFGQKDIQQFAVIKRMTTEFYLPVQIERVPTTREASGLAMSSRNAYLGRRRLKAATLLYRMLNAAKDTFYSLPANQRTRTSILDSAMKVYNAEKETNTRKEISNPTSAVQFRLDYLSLAHPDTLQEISDMVGPQGAVMSLAIYFQPLKKDSKWEKEVLGINGDTTVVRLIDNELLGVN